MSRPLLLLGLLLIALPATAVAAVTAAPDPLAAAHTAYTDYRYHDALRLLDSAPAELAATAAAHRTRGLALGRLGQWSDSVKALEQAHALAPANVDILVDLAGAQGQAALASGPFGKFSGARRTRALLEKAVAQDPNHIDARAGLFSFYLQAPGIVGGGREKALVQLDALRRLNPTAALLAEAEVAWADDDAPAALTGYRRAQEHAPTDFRAYYGFGRLAALSGQQLDAGLASLRTALDLPAHPRTPGLPGVYLRLGDIHRRQGDLAAARAAYETSLRIDPEYRFAREQLDQLPRD